MRVTNKYNLPAPLVRAIEWQLGSHNPKSDISCTTLIDSPLQFWLKKKYSDSIVVDASDMLNALYGTLAHMIPEKFADKGAEHVEQDAFVDVNGWKVSAKVDYLLKGDVLSDYKFTSVWATVDGVKPEWERQLNVGLWLMRHDKEMAQTGASIKRLEICAMFRDWVPSIGDKFEMEVVTLPVDIWDDKVAEEYILERVKLHQEAKDLDKIPPICSDGERWMSEFAIMKHGRKNAIKAKIKTREEAEKLMEEVGGDFVREAQPKRCREFKVGERARCYCKYASNNYCPWWDSFAQAVRDKPEMAEVDSVATDPDHRRKSGDCV